MTPDQSGLIHDLNALLAEVQTENERLREGLREMKHEAFELVYADPSVSTTLFHFVGVRVDALLGDDD